MNNEKRILLIQIKAKSWFDKQNGNSYFSSQATIYFDDFNEKRIYIPFTYGFGKQYETKTVAKIKELGFANKAKTMKEQKIIFISDITENLPQMEVRKWGIEI